jgi:hypothetical protein
MKRYTLKERLFILQVVTKYVNNDMKVVDKLRNGNINNDTVEIIRQLRTNNDLNKRSDGGLLCQIASCVVGIYLNDGRKWSKNSTSKKYFDLKNKLNEEY